MLLLDPIWTSYIFVSKEFKIETLELLLTSGKTAREIGDNFSTYPHIPHKWTRDNLADTFTVYPYYCISQFTTYDLLFSF